MGRSYIQGTLVSREDLRFKEDLIFKVQRISDEIGFMDLVTDHVSSMNHH